MLAQEIIRRKRDGGALGNDEITTFVRGLVDGSWSDAQAAAMAMAVFLQGMSGAETAALTQAMTRSGRGARLGRRARCTARSSTSIRRAASATRPAS